MNANDRRQHQTIEIENDVPVPEELRQQLKRGRRAISKNVAVIEKAVRWINDGPKHEARNANAAASKFLDEFVSDSKSMMNKQGMLARRIRARLSDIQNDS